MLFGPIDKFLIETSEVPAWYYISWDEENLAIILSVHREYSKVLERIGKDSPQIDYMFRRVDSFGKSIVDEFTELNLQDRNAWGFGQTLQRIDDYGDFVCFRIFLPSKKRLDQDNVWKQFYNISASLRACFSVLNYPKDLETPQKLNILQKQLAIFDLETKVGQYGGSITVLFSISFVRWLASRYQVQKEEKLYISEVGLAMRQAQAKMLSLTEPPPEDPKQNGMILWHSQFFSLNCFGDSAGLDPSDGYRYRAEGENRGIGLTTHNVDGPIQQLILLAGIAKLCDLCRFDSNY